ncbi:hypothetical protein EHO60_02215 [Leptospira fletcheri]|uniref:DUF1564 family protein n=1 Tax=Leptospira fletcheri TaxID=2484981 RepID=A0A4R9GIV2_9LEPT|nr:hypothetical protein [Leptospira fletcheri]TGK13037.1 hypothetical protein EHO60_02215 [Leptospira fletcheri]
MEEKFVRYLIRKGVLRRIDLRVSSDLSLLWDFAVRKAGDPKFLYSHLLQSYRIRKAGGRLSQWEFRKIARSDSRKRIRVDFRDYWESTCLAYRYGTSLSGFMNALLELERDCLSQPSALIGLDRAA